MVRFFDRTIIRLEALREFAPFHLEITALSSGPQPRFGQTPMMPHARPTTNQSPYLSTTQPGYFLEGSRPASLVSSSAMRRFSGATYFSISTAVKRGVMYCGQFQS